MQEEDINSSLNLKDFKYSNPRSNKGRKYYFREYIYFKMNKNILYFTRFIQWKDVRI